MMSSNRSLFTVMVIATVFVSSFVCIFADSVSAEDDDSYVFTSFYDQLDENQKKAYDVMKTFKADGLVVTLELPNAIYTDSALVEGSNAYLVEQIKGIIDNALFALELEQPLAICTWGQSYVVPELAYLENGGLVGVKVVTLTLKVDPAYADDPETEVNEFQEKIDALNKAIEDYNVGSTNVRTMVGNINSYITSRLTYDPNEDKDNEDPYAHDAYGALVSSTKIALHDGFSKGFQALCQKYDIVCYTIYGYSNNDRADHAWNVVLMDNGKYYPVDTTWNKTTSNAHLLTSAESFQANHYAGLSPSDGGVAFDYPKLSDTKYDADPWYDNSLVEYAVIGAIGIVIVLGILLAIREDKKKLTPKK